MTHEVGDDLLRWGWDMPLTWVTLLFQRRSSDMSPIFSEKSLKSVSHLMKIEKNKTKQKQKTLSVVLRWKSLNHLDVGPAMQKLLKK